MSDIPKIKNPVFSIIILVYNQVEYTKKCINSILENTDPCYEIIVVDNGSTDNTSEFLSGLTGIKVITNKENLGFAKGNNMGVKCSTGDFIIILNNDTIVTPSWLNGLFACMKSDPRIGVVGPMTNYISGPQRDKDASYKTIHEMMHYALEFRTKYRKRWIDFPRITGFCMMVRRTLWEQLGGFDERFEIGNFEDDDFCRRAIHAGFRNVIAGDVFIHHFGSVTFKALNIDYGKIIEENKRKYVEKWNELNNKSEKEHKKEVVSKIEKFLENGSCNDAKIEIEKLLNCQKPDKDICNLYGRILAALEDLNGAIQWFERAYEMEPECSTALSNLGVVFWKKKDFGKALEYFTKALAIDSENSDLLHNIGLVYQNIGDMERAIKIYRKLIKISESDVDAWVTLGILLIEKGEPEGFHVLEKAGEKNPDNSTIHEILDKIRTEHIRI